MRGKREPQKWAISAAVRYIIHYMMRTKEQGQFQAKTTLLWLLRACRLSRQMGYQDSNTLSKGNVANGLAWNIWWVLFSRGIKDTDRLRTVENKEWKLYEGTSEVVWLTGLMSEVKVRMVPRTIDIPTIKYTIFSHNEGAKAMAVMPKMNPRWSTWSVVTCIIPLDLLLQGRSSSIALTLWTSLLL